MMPSPSNGLEPNSFSSSKVLRAKIGCGGYSKERGWITLFSNNRRLGLEVHVAKQAIPKSLQVSTKGCSTKSFKEKPRKIKSPNPRTSRRFCLRHFTCFLLESLRKRKKPLSIFRRQTLEGRRRSQLRLSVSCCLTCLAKLRVGPVEEEVEVLAAPEGALEVLVEDPPAAGLGLCSEVEWVRLHRLQMAHHCLVIPLITLVWLSPA